jgi:hypothetical protein
VSGGNFAEHIFVKCPPPKKKQKQNQKEKEKEKLP